MQIAISLDQPLSQYPYLEHHLLMQYEELVYNYYDLVPDFDDLVAFAVLYANDTLREEEVRDAWEYTNIPRDKGFDDYFDFRQAVLEDEIEELIPEHLIDEDEVRSDIWDYLVRHQVVFRQDDVFFNIPIVEVW